MIHRRGFWLLLIAINMLAATVAAAVLGDFTLDMPLGRIVRTVLPDFIVSTTISSLCSVVLSWLAPVLYHRAGPWLRWSVLITTLILLAVVGSIIAVALIVALGLAGPWSGFWAILENTVRIAIAITLVFGVYSTITEALRVQLADAALALRTKERDEAEARRLAAEAQRASLEARVNPHFFFNTLNSIAALIPDDPAGAEKMTTQLASLMRTSLHDGSSPLLPLEQELGNVRDYLEIERTRFGNRLRFTIQAADAVHAALVPRLSLQTLVENSVKYAVMPRREGASVVVSAAADDGHVRIDVSDDGPGFDPSTAPDGHGLSLVRARLAQAFGDRAGFAVTSRPGLTVVSLTLPLIPLPDQPRGSAR